MIKTTTILSLLISSISFAERAVIPMWLQQYSQSYTAPAGINVPQPDNTYYIPRPWVADFAIDSSGTNLFHTSSTDLVTQNLLSSPESIKQLHHFAFQVEPASFPGSIGIRRMGGDTNVSLIYRASHYDEYQYRTVVSSNVFLNSNLRNFYPDNVFPDNRIDSFLGYLKATSDANFAFPVVQCGVSQVRTSGYSEVLFTIFGSTLPGPERKGIIQRINNELFFVAADISTNGLCQRAAAEMGHIGRYEELSNPMYYGAIRLIKILGYTKGIGSQVASGVGYYRHRGAAFRTRLISFCRESDRNVS